MRAPSVLVVGAGPVGLALACELARHGVAFRLVDAAPAASVHSKALGIHARTLEVLDDMGIVERVLAGGRRMRATNIWSSGKQIVHVPFDAIPSPYPFVLCLPQSDTERVLGERLVELGGRVERSCRLSSLAQDEGGVDVTLVHGGVEERARFAWVVGCDGSHSTVRHALDLPFEGAAYEEPFLLGDVRLEWPLADDAVHAFLSPDGVAACFPMPEAGRWRVVADGRSASDPPTAEELGALLAARGAPSPTVDDARWTASFRIHRRIVPRYRVGRIFLAGDAAHIHSPVGGQGMNTGIQDAYNLAWKLALVDGGAARSELLDSYDAERRPIAAATLALTDRATRAATLRNPIARGVRDVMMQLFSGLDRVQQKILDDASEIAVAYRGSKIVGESRAAGRLLHSDDDERASLADQARFRAAPHPGDRAPDVALDGERRLFDLLRGTPHTLLLFDGSAATAEGYRRLRAIADRAADLARDRLRAFILVPRREPPVELAGDARVILDPESAAHRRYGASAECLYLVRPDGYVGFRSQPADGDALAAHLAQLLVPSR